MVKFTKRTKKQNNAKAKGSIKVNNKRKLTKKGNKRKGKSKYDKRTKQSVRNVDGDARTFTNGNAGYPNTNSSAEEDEDLVDMIEKDDLDYLKSSYNKISFLRDVEKDLLANKKRPHMDDEGGSSSDEGEEYEKAVRNNFIPSKKLRPLLPLKGKDGLIPRNVEIEEETDDLNQTTVEKVSTVLSDNRIETCQEPSTLVELCAQRHKLLKTRKQRIGVVAMSVIENPEENINKVKELIFMLEEQNPVTFLSTQKMVALSLLEVFKDIIPGYCIRLPTEKEKAQRVKKDVKSLRNYEETLLRLYKRYLQKLEFMTMGLTKKGMNRAISFNISKEAQLSLGVVALKCFTELLVTHPHFNFRGNITSVVARLLAHKDETISNLCCEAFKRLYAEDKLGESSLEAVRLTSKLVKAQGNQVPPKVLETFLSLKISEASLKMEEQQKKNAKQIQKEMKMMSRKEKKWKKKMAKLEKELLETEAEESKEKKTRFHTEILNHVFVTYFRILKSENPSSLLLTPVLKGLSKFAHLINIEFFDDLISIICKMLDSSNLSDIQTFHCLHTVFTILSGEGQALNIDPQHFYVHLYKNLLQQSLVKDDSVIQTLLICIDIMILKRKKKLTFRRMLALIKRISTMSLYQAHNGALSFLACVKLMLQSSRMYDVIVDTEEGHGSGMFMPEIEDPEYCNANATVLWEVCNLRRHYHPAVRKYALHIALKCPMQGEGQLPVELSKKSPLEMLEEFSMKNMEFNPPLTSLSEMGLKVGKKRKMHPFSYSSTNLVSAAKSIYQKRENVELDFFQHLDRDRLHLLHSAQSLNV